MEGLQADFLFMSSDAQVLAGHTFVDLLVDKGAHVTRSGRSMAHLEATEQLHMLNTHSLGTSVTSASEGPRSGGEDIVGGL